MCGTWEGRCGGNWGHRNRRHWCTWERAVSATAWPSVAAAAAAATSNGRRCWGHWGTLLPHVRGIFPCFACRLHLFKRKKRISSYIRKFQAILLPLLTVLFSQKAIQASCEPLLEVAVIVQLCSCKKQTASSWSCSSVPTAHGTVHHLNIQCSEENPLTLIWLGFVWHEEQRHSEQKKGKTPL